MIYAIRPLSRILIAAGFLLLASVISCQPDEPTAPAVTGISLGKGGPPPKVDEADPPSAPQDITLDVRVLGSGFDDGSVATWTIDGVPQPEVRTNSTRFVSSKELVANITIDATAPVELYDIEVVTTRGKKGIGGDLFAVLKKGTASFSLIELEPLEGTDGARGQDLNDAGQIVGSSGGLNVPTLWTITETNGTLSATVTALDFPTSWFFGAPQAITNSGVAVGTFQDDGESTTGAALWDVDLNQASVLPLTGAGGRAADVSSFDGGYIAVGQQDREGVYWENGLGPHTLPPVAPGAVTSAKAVNSSGIIAGDSDLTAVIWVRLAGGSYGPPCPLEMNSFVYGMSEVTASGHVYVVGRWNVSVSGNGAVWKVTLSSTSGTCELDGDPRHLDFLSRLNDVSDAGDAVGEDAQKHRAILWTDDGQLIELPGFKKGGGGSIRAMAITPDGKRIVGASALPKGRGSTGVLWLRF